LSQFFLTERGRPLISKFEGRQVRAQPRAGAYRFGRIEIDGRTYTSDVIILPTGVQANWWRDEGHVLKPEDLHDVVDASPDVLVIGQGAHGGMRVAKETLTHLREAGIEAVCAPTGQAVEMYNERRRGGERVAAALHLTC
jgi:hypothetical protein